jgi:hypothetical protein
MTVTYFVFSKLKVLPLFDWERLAHRVEAFHMLKSKFKLANRQPAHQTQTLRCLIYDKIHDK